MSKRLKLPTLLLISDNPSIRHWIKKYLDEKFFILDAQTKEKALEDVRSSSLDFIILDAEFKDAPALALTKEIRSKLKNSLTPIFLITGRLKRSFREEALSSGVTDFLNSQLDLEELESRIASGKKMQELGEKTADLSSQISLSQKKTASASLKDKFVLTKEGLEFLQKAKEKNLSIALLTLQINRFEELYAKVGPSLEKDLFLSFSQFIQEKVRGDHLLLPSLEGRLLVLLVEKEPNQSEKIAKDLAKQVEKKTFSTPKGSLHLTISIAVGSFQASEEAFTKVVNTAIKALKQEGDQENMIISLNLEDL